MVYVYEKEDAGVFIYLKPSPPPRRVGILANVIWRKNMIFGLIQRQLPLEGLLGTEEWGRGSVQVLRIRIIFAGYRTQHLSKKNTDANIQFSLLISSQLMSSKKLSEATPTIIYEPWRKIFSLVYLFFF